MTRAGLAFLCGFLLAWLLDLHHVQRTRRWQPWPPPRRVRSADIPLDFEHGNPPAWRDLEQVDAV